MNNVRKPLLILALILILVSILLGIIDSQSTGKSGWFDLAVKLYLVMILFAALFKKKVSN